MKTYDEMFRCVLARRDAAMELKLQRERAVRRAAPVLAAFCFAVLLGSGVWMQQGKLPSIPAPPSPAAPTAPETQAATEDTTEMVSETETTVFTAESASSPETDTAAFTTEPTQTDPVAVETDAAEVPVNSTPPETAETVIPETEPAAPAETTVAPTEPTTEEIPTITDDQITGFRVEQYTHYRRVICTDSFPAPRGELTAFSVEDDTLELVGTSDETSDTPIRSYEILAPGSGRVYTVTQREYAEFALTVEEGELIDIGLNRAHGFFLLQENTCTLYWFSGGEGFCVSGETADLRDLLAIARSFTPAEQ